MRLITRKLNDFTFIENFYNFYKYKFDKYQPINYLCTALREKH
jgi:hypothetical protein